MPVYFKPVLFIVSIIPFITLIINAVNGNLGANPIEKITHETGEWALRFLLITLSITPLRQLSKKAWLIQVRRMLGLFAFFYASLHFLAYLVLDQFFAWQYILEDIADRPYITIGFLAFVLLIPLAVTSSNKMMKHLGKNWKKLHQLIYIIAVLGVLHFFWLTKADYFEPIIYAGILLVLYTYRVVKLKKLPTH